MYESPADSECVAAAAGEPSLPRCIGLVATSLPVIVGRSSIAPTPKPLAILSISPFPPQKFAKQSSEAEAGGGIAQAFVVCACAVPGVSFGALSELSGRRTVSSSRLFKKGFVEVPLLIFEGMRSVARSAFRTEGCPTS